MTAITKNFTVIADAAVAPDAPVDTTLMTELRDNDIHLREWLGASFYAGAVQDHNHDGVNSSAIEVGPNHIRNGSFESSTNNWTLTDYTGGSHAIDSTHYIHGKQALAITSTVLANGGGQALSNDFIAVAGSRYYTVSGYLWASVANVSAKMQIVWYDNTQAQISTTDVVNATAAPTTATEYGGAYQAPATARYARVLLIGGVPAAGAATGTVYFDGVGFSVERSVGGRITQALIENSAVGQVQLKTGLQQNTGINTGGSPVAIVLGLTGGLYSFWTSWADQFANNSLLTNVANAYVTNTVASISAGASYHMQCYYVASSPPYDLGDGVVPLFVFALIDATGNVLAVDVAQDPPWYYNGPNRVTKHAVINGQTVGIRRRLKLTNPITPGMTPTQLAALASDLSAPQWIETPVLTVADKNLDMPVIPHPFMGNNLAGKTVVLLDPVSPLVARLLSMHEVNDPAARVTDLLMQGYLKVSNTALPRNAPPGVMPVAASWRLT